MNAAAETLLWDPVSDADIAGYKLYYGLTSRTYGPPIDVGNQTSYPLAEFEDGQTYYFAVTALNTDLVESNYSEELVWTGSTPPPAVNQPPVANDSSLSVIEDGEANGTLSANDPDGDNLSYVIVTNGTKGTAEITNVHSGSFTYSPNANIVGPDTFTFKVNDGKTDSNEATVSVNISTVNDPPTISGVPPSNVVEGTPYSFKPSVSDIDTGDTLSFSIVNKPGWAAFNNATGLLSGTPGNANIGTTQDIIISVTDSGGAKASLSPFDLTVASDNSDTHIQLELSWMQNTETDLAGYKVYYGTESRTYGAPIEVGKQTSYTITGLEEGQVYYFAITAYDTQGYESGYSQEVSWKGQVAGSEFIMDNGDPGTTSSGVWDVSSLPNGYGENSLYSRYPGAVYTFENAINGTSEISLWWSAGENRCSDVSIEVYDGDSYLNTLHINQQTNGGQWNIGGTFAFNGSAKLVVNSQSDACSTCADAVRFVSAGSAQIPNEFPVANNDSLTTPENTVATGTLSASDADGDALTYAIVNNGSKGKVTFTDSSTGAFMYSPDAGVIGADIFTYKVNDGKADSNTASVTINITNYVLPGDIDDSGSVDLVDLRLVQEILAGMSPEEIVYKEADIDGDGNIGMAEFLYVLQNIANPR